MPKNISSTKAKFLCLPSIVWVRIQDDRTWVWVVFRIAALPLTSSSSLASVASPTTTTDHRCCCVVVVDWRLSRLWDAHNNGPNVSRFSKQVVTPITIWIKSGQIKEANTARFFHNKHLKGKLFSKVSCDHCLGKKYTSWNHNTKFPLPTYWHFVHTQFHSVSVSPSHSSPWHRHTLPLA